MSPLHMSHPVYVFLLCTCHSCLSVCLCIIVYKCMSLVLNSLSLSFVSMIVYLLLEPNDNCRKSLLLGVFALHMYLIYREFFLHLKIAVLLFVWSIHILHVSVCNIEHTHRTARLLNPSLTLL